MAARPAERVGTRARLFPTAVAGNDVRYRPPVRTVVVSKRVMVIFAFALLLILTGCAAGPNVQRSVANPEGDVAGFWLGLWHGIISPVAFFISLFADGVNIYEVHNNGNWYNFGFVIGAGILFSGGAAGARKRKRT